MISLHRSAFNQRQSQQTTTNGAKWLLLLPVHRSGRLLSRVNQMILRNARSDRRPCHTETRCLRILSFRGTLSAYHTKSFLGPPCIPRGICAVYRKTPLLSCRVQRRAKGAYLQRLKTQIPRRIRLFPRVPYAPCFPACRETAAVVFLASGTQGPGGSAHLTTGLSPLASRILFHQGTCPPLRLAIGSL